MTMRSGFRTVLVAGSVTAALALGCGGARDARTRQPHELTIAEKVRMAQSLMKAGRVGDALEEIDEAIAMEPENARLHGQRGQLLFLVGRYPDAQQAFLTALELDPYLTDAHNYLGAVYDELGRVEEAERHYKIALQDPSYPTPELVYLNLGLLYADDGRDREAIESLRRSVEIDPKFYKAHYELGVVLERLGRLEEAARELEVAGPGYGSVGGYHYRLGLTYFRLGDHQRARTSLERVIAVAPGSPSAAQADDLLRALD